MPSSTVSSMRWQGGSPHSTSRRSPIPSDPVNAASVPSDADIVPKWDAFLASVQRPVSQTRIKALLDRGFHRPGDVGTRSDITSANWAAETA